MPDNVPPFLNGNPAAAGGGASQPDFPNRPQTGGDKQDIDPASVRVGGAIYQPQMSEVSKKVNGPGTGPMGAGEGPKPFKGLTQKSK